MEATPVFVSLIRQKTSRNTIICRPIPKHIPNRFRLPSLAVSAGLEDLLGPHVAF